MTAFLLLRITLATPPPAMRDQLGRADGLERHRGTTVVALVVTAKRLRSLRGWQLELDKRLTGISYLRVADIPKEPPVDHERVAAKLRERVPDEVPIGIDLERSWATSYGLATEEVNLLVFDPHGQLAERLRGRRSKALVDKAVAAVERVQRTQRGVNP